MATILAPIVTAGPVSRSLSTGSGDVNTCKTGMCSFVGSSGQRYLAMAVGRHFVVLDKTKIPLQDTRQNRMDVNGRPTAQEEASGTQIMVDLHLNLVCVNNQPEVFPNQLNASI